ncbi:hypothetical protein PR202_gb12289 [Eleusine coracana subsp. coracana]|uniref:Uncharacterized protein n=1 Tax=Eleusine coracana subsp. coracana TaxID=191504 RepID=A0AAV5EP77_ELECO|nr:hypothetical protein PR202_gb12289 [Eleusine coracana subsp. coracana]
MTSSSPMVLSLLLLLSLTALLLLAPRLSPPPPPGALHAADEEQVPAASVTATGGLGSGGVPSADEPDDLALFRRATLEAAVTSSSSAAAAAAPPKVAFLFLTTTDLHFAPLWERFFAGHESRRTVYVHADPSSRLNRLLLTPSFRGRFVAAKPTRRADASLIAAARRLLAAALLDDPANAYFALLSPYIEVLKGEPQMASRYAARGGEAAMLPEVPYARFRIGSQFFALARRHAALVVRESRLWRKFRAPCKPEARDHECYPEEHYFPTLLDMADPAGVARYTLTRVNWTGSVAGHPHTYAAAEVSPGLIRELRVSNNTHPYMFARKFAPECLAPLMDIADSVIFKD